MNKNRIIFLSSLFIIPISILFSNTIEVNAANPVPTLDISQNGSTVDLEWAVEMPDNNILYNIGFEEGTELPDLTFNASGNRQFGGQSFTTEDKYSGSRSLKIVDSYTNGNYLKSDLNGNLSYWEWSLARFLNRKYMKNGTDLSISFRAKTNGKGNILFSGGGGKADIGMPIDVTFTSKVNVGDRTAKVSDPYFFKQYVDRGQQYYLANMKGDYTNAIIVTSVNLSTSEITVSDPFEGEFNAGDNVLVHQYIQPVNFTSVDISKEDGWKLFNANAKVADSIYYNTLTRGFDLWIRTTTHDTVYIDDMKLGYATKAQLFRNGTMIYEGYLSQYKDTGIVDKASPNKVSNISYSKEGDKWYAIFSNPSDNGTDYNYNVKSIFKDNSSSTSSTKKITMLSGVKGYSYIIDNNPTTVPDNTIDSTTGKVNIPINFNESSYIHIKTIDNAGNVSDTSHIRLGPTFKNQQTLEIPTISPFPSITLKDQPVSYSTSMNSAIFVTDIFPNTGEGWRLDVSATQLHLTDNSYMLPKGSLTLEPLSTIKGVDQYLGSLPTKGFTTTKNIDDGKVVIASASSGNGIGKFELTFPKDALKIKIDPTTAKRGKYSTIITWNLVSAP